MIARRYSADAKARLAFTLDRLNRAVELVAFARRAGRVSEKMLSMLAQMQRDHQRAVEGKTVAAFDALGGRGIWKEQQEGKAA